jgi:hypothetical protein
LSCPHHQLAPADLLTHAPAGHLAPPVSGFLRAPRTLFERVLLNNDGADADRSNVSRLRYLLAATLALAAVGVGVEHVLLAGAYQPLPPQPQPGLVTGPSRPPPPPPPPPVPSSKVGPGTARAKANVQAAAAAIEQYAAAHGHSYLGATAARLRHYDPQLDASVHVFSAAVDSYCVESSVWGVAVSQNVPGGLVLQPCGWSA